MAILTINFKILLMELMFDWIVGPIGYFNRVLSNRPYRTKQLNVVKSFFLSFLLESFGLRPNVTDNNGKCRVTDRYLTICTRTNFS